MHFPLHYLMPQGNVLLSAALGIMYLHVGLHTFNVRAKVGLIESIQNWLGANGVSGHLGCVGTIFNITLKIKENRSYQTW